MSDLTLSLLGMYNEEQQEIADGGIEGSFLDVQHFILPTEFTEQERNDLCNIILSESAELEVLYPNPSTMRTIVPAWSRARLPAWERMLTALNTEYNPTHNYDRFEVETGTDTGSRNETENVTDSSSDTTTGQTTGFNSNSFADDKKTTSSGSGTRQGTRGETRNLANSRNLHAYGNIGVTTAMQMVKEEIDLRKTDIIRIIANEFLSYFCLMIY